MNARGPGCDSKSEDSTVRLFFVGSERARSAIERRIAADPRMRITGVAADGTAALERMPLFGVDSVVIDANALGSNAASAVRCLAHDSGGRTPVVVLGDEGDEYAAARLLVAGASAYVSDGAPDSELLRAIEVVRAHRRYISPQLRDRMAFRYVDES